MTQIGGTGVYEDLKSEYAEIKTKWQLTSGENCWSMGGLLEPTVSG